MRIARERPNTLANDEPVGVHPSPPGWLKRRFGNMPGWTQSVSPELGGALLGIASLGGVLGWWVGTAFLDEATRFIRIIAVPTIIVLACLVGCVLLHSTATFVQARVADFKRRSALQIASLPWLVFLACVPVMFSITRSGHTAHVLLMESTAGHFGLYLIGWWILLQSGLFVGVWLAVRAQSGDRSEEGQRESHRLPTAWAAVGFAVGLTALFNLGILDQLTMEQGEFLTHRRASEIMLHEGRLPYNLGRPIWHRINVPPSTFVLFWGPWTLLPAKVGLYLHFFAHYAAFLTAVILLLRRHVRGLRPLELSVVLMFIVSLFAPWREAIWLGQPNGFILLLTVLALRWFVAGRTWAVAAAIAAALTLKPTTIWLLVYFLVRRSMRILIAIGLFGIATVLLAAAIGGIEPWRVWLTEQAPLLWRGAALFTSIGLPSLHARLFLTAHGYVSPAPLPYLPLAQALNYTAVVGGAWLLLRLVRRDRPEDDSIGKTLEFGLALALSLALSPLTWLHYATTALVGLIALIHPRVRASLPPPVRAPILGLGGFAFATISIDTELLMVRTSSWWVDFPLIGSLNNFGPPTLVATLAIVLWLYNRQSEGSCAANARLS